MSGIREYNDYHISNPAGNSRRIAQYRPTRYPNERPEYYVQNPTRDIPQWISTAQTFPWRPEESRRRWETEDEEWGDEEAGERRKGENPNWGRVPGFEPLSEREDDLPTLEGAETSVFGIQAVSAGIAAAALSAVLYITSLVLTVTPCSPAANTLAFISPLRNPKNTPLQVELVSETGSSITRELTESGYLLFDGLENDTEYTLSIVNPETGANLYQASYVTAVEDAYHIDVENGELHPDGTFTFDLSVDGLGEGEFYTVRVLDTSGRVLYVADGTDENASFSVPTGMTLEETVEERGGEKAGDMEQDGTDRADGADSEDSEDGGEPPALPFVTTSIGGQMFMPRVWPDPVPETRTEEARPETVEDAAESLPDEEVPVEEEGVPEEELLEEPEEEEVSPEEEAPDEEELSPEEETPDEEEVSLEEAVPDEQEVFPELEEAVPDEEAVFPEEEIPVEAELPRNEEIPTVPTDEEESFDASEVNWVWSKDLTSAAAEFSNPNNPRNVVTRKADVTETREQTSCTEEGLRTCTASVTGPDGETYTDTRTAALPARGHSYERADLREEDGSTVVEYVCKECGQIYRISASATEEASGEVEETP